MGKTQTPLKILIVGRNPGPLYETEEIQRLIEKGDKVEQFTCDADMIIGESAMKSLPKTVRFTITAIENLRKEQHSGKNKRKSKESS
jgi:hypothetical protein